MTDTKKEVSSATGTVAKPSRVSSRGNALAKPTTETKRKPKKRTSKSKPTQSQTQKQVINFHPYRAQKLRAPTAYGGSPNRPYPINFSVISNPTIQTPINQYDIPSLTNRALALDNAFKSVVQARNEAKATQTAYDSLRDMNVQTSNQLPDSSMSLGGFSMPSSPSSMPPPPPSPTSMKDSNTTKEASTAHSVHHIPPPVNVNEIEEGSVKSPGQRHSPSTSLKGVSVVELPEYHSKTIGSRDSSSTSPSVRKNLQDARDYLEKTNKYVDKNNRYRPYPEPTNKRDYDYNREFYDKQAKKPDLPSLVTSPTTSHHTTTVRSRLSSIHQSSSVNQQSNGISSVASTHPSRPADGGALPSGRSASQGAQFVHQVPRYSHASSRVGSGGRVIPPPLGGHSAPHIPPENRPPGSRGSANSSRSSHSHHD